jgi:hypothetical protein
VNSCGQQLPFADMDGLFASNDERDLFWSAN